MISKKWPKYQENDWNFTLKTFGLKQNRQEYQILRDSQRLEELTIEFPKSIPILIGFHSHLPNKDYLDMKRWFDKSNKTSWAILSPSAQKVLTDPKEIAWLSLQEKHIREYSNSMHNTSSESLCQTNRQFILQRTFSRHLNNKQDKKQNVSKQKLNCQFITKYDLKIQKQTTQNAIFQNFDLLALAIALFLNVKDRCLMKVVSPFWFSCFSDIRIWKIHEVLEWFLLSVNEGNLNNIFWNMKNLRLYQRNTSSETYLSFTPWEITFQDMDVRDQDELIYW